MPSQASARANDRTIATNRRARHDYAILETVGAGLVLRGTEVKSLRAGQVTFKDSYATVRNEEAWLVGCHISPYSHGSDANHDPERDRKLLLHRREITRLVGKIARSEEHTSELQSQSNLVCRLLLEKKNKLIEHLAAGSDPSDLRPVSLDN